MSEKSGNSAKETFENMLDKTLEISRISYEQESDRNKQLLNKSDYVIKYISTIIIFVNIFFPILFANKVIKIKILILIYLFISFPLIASLFYSIRSQILKKVEFFPTGDVILKKIKSKEKNFENDIEIQNRIIIYYSRSTKRLQATNDKKAKLLKTAYRSFIFSIIFLVISILITMMLIA